MNHTKTVRRATGCTRLVPRALLVVLTVMSVLAADQAMARKAKGGLSPGSHSAPAAQAAAQSAPVSPEVIKPIPHPRRHGARGRGVTR
jgi:hypothetical protein